MDEVMTHKLPARSSRTPCHVYRSSCGIAQLVCVAQRWSEQPIERTLHLRVSQVLFLRVAHK